MKRLVAMVLAVMALSGALLFGCSSASGPYQDSGWYKSLDLNHDGVVDKDEKKQMSYSGM